MRQVPQLILYRHIQTKYIHVNRRNQVVYMEFEEKFAEWIEQRYSSVYPQWD